MQSTSLIKSKNPYTKQTLKEYTTFTPKQINEKLQTANLAFESWRKTNFTQRKELLYNVATLLEERAEEYGRLISNEMGKPVSQAIAEVKKCASVCRYYADNAADFLKIKPIKTEAYKSYVHFVPKGAVLGIMPWNFPFWYFFRFLAPSIITGNVAVLKYALHVFVSYLTLST